MSVIRLSPPSTRSREAAATRGHRQVPSRQRPARTATDSARQWLPGRLRLLAPASLQRASAGHRRRQLPTRFAHSEILLVEAHNLQNNAPDHGSCTSRGHELLNRRSCVDAGHTRTWWLGADRQTIHRGEPVPPHATPASRPPQGSRRRVVASISGISRCKAGLPPLTLTQRGAPSRPSSASTISSPFNHVDSTRTVAGSTAYIVSHHEHR